MNPYDAVPYDYESFEDGALLASEFDWDGKLGKISKSKLQKLCGVEQLYEFIEIKSDKTGTKMVFHDAHRDGIYQSRQDSSIMIKVYEDKPVPKFPFGHRSELYGKYFALTGSLSWGRSHLIVRIAELGGRVQSSVNSQTDYLISEPGITGTTKVQNALKWGTTIVDGEEFIKFLESVS